MEEEQLIEEIRNLYKELLLERNGKYINNDFLHWHAPNGISYYHTAEKLINKVTDLQNMNGTYEARCLLKTLGKEVTYVREYKYEYNGNQIKQSSLNNMQKLMDKASKQIKYDLWEILRYVN